MNAPQALNSLRPASTAVSGTELPHESAVLHVTGEATFTDDIPELRGTLYAALVTSPVAHGKLLGPHNGVDKAALLAEHGVVAVFTAQDIPGENNCGPIVHDDPFLAPDVVQFIGQPVAVVVAREMVYAREAARKAKLNIEALPPVLTIEQALEAQSFVMPSKTVLRGDPDAALAAAPHRLKGSTRTGQQEQFYLEGHITYAVPREDGQLTLYTSSQHPEGNQKEAAAALNLSTKDVEVICRRMGGGFGGKEGNASIFSQSAALAAFLLKKPIKLRVGRDDDMTITGKRHDFRIDYDVGFDADGRIQGLDLMLASRCGYSIDYSGPVNDRALLHIDNAYYVPNVRAVGHRCKTNTQSSTAFRGFGGPQGMFAIETVIDEIARHLGRDPLDVRRANLYHESADPATLTTQYGQKIEDWVGDQVLAQVEEQAGYRARRAEVAAFNAAHATRKRGLAITPLKFGISFTATLLNQAGALVNIFNDGSVAVNHGGTEMGQGLNTKIAQLTADELGISVKRVRVTATDTLKVPNASATAASSGFDLNGAATRNACEQLRARLTPVAAEALGCTPEEVVFANDGVNSPAGGYLDFKTLASKAWASRVGLSQTGFYRTPEIGYDPAKLQGRAFYYYCYGASVSEVELDLLTGEWRLLKVDAVHDVGQSINPALDRGQIEGGYIQGMGWLTMEECLWDAKGKLLTHGPSTYKIPVASDVPEDFHVTLFDGRNVKPTPYRTKATGEPPLMLALSAFFALKDAVGAAAPGNRQVPLVAPATPERLLLAVKALRRHG
ncbi:xanthine dehydrogenase molybdopterin binding subunit [Ideonella livida]|uniref:Xanthine dehydrogenase molybdopterin binding subunit n=1 Tax=Ideonella livida TaxID=2707176 RepID=A0A7C9PE84_9BURK|nr:xanthine dehydrogenase molybdopterin binding subunit [Ideonella livida]NDY89617.1 xanthine dehydrogenase molybdopterin binding subunit [Ideonella livida]